MSPTTAPADPGRWIPVRDRVTGRLLCEYDPDTGRIRVRRNRRYYYASVPIPPGEGLPAAAAHRLLHQLDAAHPEHPDDDRPDP